jgi:hypothetical protein
LATTDNFNTTTTEILGASKVVSNIGCVKTYETSFTPSDLASFYKLTATAHEGFEGTVIDTAMLTVPVKGIDAINDALTVESGTPGTLNVLTNDIGTLNPASLTIVTPPQNGSLQIGTGGLVTYLPNGSFTGIDQFVYRICNTRVPTPDCDTAIVTITVLPNYNDPCIEAVSAKTYYMPFPENESQLRQALFSASSGGQTYSNVVRNVTSIKSTYPNAIITYDEWEDGYESDITVPVQSTTKVWGDGNVNNGVAPGYPTDIIPAGGSLILDNTFIYNPRNAANIYFDGKDKIYSTSEIAVSKITGDNSFFAVQSSKTDVYDITRFGKLFTLGLGEITPIAGYEYFQYASVFIRASVNGTIVSLDYNGDGTVEQTKSLNEGEVWFYEGDPDAVASATDLKPGAVITANQPVGVDILFG